MTAKEKALEYVAPAAKSVVSRYIDEHVHDIAEQVVEEELNVPYWNNDTKKYQKATCNRVLSRIKTLTENE